MPCRPSHSLRPTTSCEGRELTGYLLCKAGSLPFDGLSSPLVGALGPSIALPSIAMRSPDRGLWSGCGGGGSAGIRRDLVAGRHGGSRRHDVGGYDVLAAGAPVGDDDRARGGSARHAVRRMSRLSGISTSAPRRPVEGEVPKSWMCENGIHIHCVATSYCECWCHVLAALDYTHLVSGGARGRALAEIASAARTRARAWVFPTRHGFVRDSGSLEGSPPPPTKTTRIATSCRAGKAQSRPACLAWVDRRNPGRARGLRRRGQALVRARIAGR
jgi:hypothetical protein